MCVHESLNEKTGDGDGELKQHAGVSHVYNEDALALA